MARIGVQRWSLNRRMRACVTLCHSLCTAARSPVVFLGNGFISLMRLDIYDHIDIRTLRWIFEDINRRIGKKPLAYLRQLYLPMHDYQCVAHYEARGCDQYISVQLGLRNVSLQSLLTHPFAGSPTAREICDFIGPDGMSSEDAIYCPPKNGWSCHSRLIEGNKGNNTPALPYCCIF